MTEFMEDVKLGNDLVDSALAKLSEEEYSAVYARGKAHGEADGLRKAVVAIESNVSALFLAKRDIEAKAVRELLGIVREKLKGLWPYG